MKNNIRGMKKWRKDKPATHRTYGEKRDRVNNFIEEEINTELEENKKSIDQELEKIDTQIEKEEKEKGN